MRFVGFIGPSYVGPSVNVDCQRCINLYPELDEIGTGKEKEIASLVSTPGLSLLVTIGTGPYRGTYEASNGSLFVVSGNGLYQVTSSWTYTLLGTLNTSSGPVSLADNGLQLVAVDGPNGYVWDITLSTFTTISDPAFPGADQVTFQDSYFIFNKPSSQQFFISGLSKVSFNALDIAQAEGFPDKINGHISDHRNLWLFGTDTTEVWFDSGAAAFPFQRIEGAYIEVGCVAKFSIAKMNNTVFWLGRDKAGSGIVYMANGYQPTRISTHAVERQIQSYGDLSGTTAYCYQENGHYFYVLNFVGAATTWVFDTTTKLWHERIFLNQGNFERHRAQCHAYAFNTHVVGDYQNGNLYKMSSQIYSDNGSEILRQRVAPHMTDGLKRLFYDSFQLDIETGTGLDGIAQGTDPQAILQFSDDGGHTWSNEKWVSFGKIGQTRSRALWRRLGQSRDRVFRLSITDPVPVTLIGADMTVTKGAN